MTMSWNSTDEKKVLDSRDYKVFVTTQLYLSHALEQLKVRNLKLQNFLCVIGIIRVILLIK